MRDRWVVTLAIGAWLGALASWPLPRVVGAVVALVGLACRRPALLVLGVALLACSLGAAARAGLAPEPERAFVGEVTLVSDPVPVRGGVRVDVRAHGARYEAVAHGAAARQLRARAAGDLVRLDGRVKPRPRDAPWLDARHVVARLEVSRVHGARDGSIAARLVNGLRGVLARGARALPSEQRPLYTGMVFGDDRGQTPVTIDDLRAAGLGHLLAVSGQNVAVTLAAARPLLERCRYRVRFPLTLAFLGLLVLVTRAEPSVLRAAAMSGIVALAATLGRSASSLRVLALAVTGLVLVDPLLVDAVGFQLSVAASAGIVVFATPLALRLPLPRALADVASVTVAAQLAVAPVALSAFGGLPVAALPANVVAAPASGPVMVWGATAGVVAGLIGGPVATVLHAPTRLLLWWVQVVGGVAGRLPLGELRAGHVALAAVAGAVWATVRPQARRRRRALRGVAAVTLASALLHPAWELRGMRVTDAAVATGVRLWRDGDHAVVMLDGRADPVRTLQALRRAGVRRLDLVVARSGSVLVSDVVRALDARYRVGAVWAPARHEIRGAATPAAGTTARAGPFTVTVEAVQPRLLVDVTRA
ncbi:MAG TPA: ComEC/Rec2 family competence protein [Acidimicrobiales bacterium]